MPDARETQTNVIVAGASGYSGALAAELVDRHPRLNLVHATSRSHAGKRLHELYPRYRSEIELTELDLEELEDVEAAIVAYPHAAATPVVAGMRGLGLSVVDLSADFRLVDAEIYELWYGDHGEPELLENAIYGLTELSRDSIRTGELVANPGCYPTAALLALAPLAERGLLESVLIDAKSGVSGSGRDGGEGTAFANVTENASPYAVEGHRHQPEIEQELERMGAGVPVTFVPHLLPIDQGLLASCYVGPARAGRGGRPDLPLSRALRRRSVRGDRRLAPGRPRRARHEQLPDPRRLARRAESGRLRRDRQPLEGRRGAGGPEPEPDARI